MINTIVIDTETMDVRPSALILSIGAFAFDVADLEGTRESILAVSRDPELSEYSTNAFYCLLDANDQLMLGRSVSKIHSTGGEIRSRTRRKHYPAIVNR